MAYASYRPLQARDESTARAWLSLFAQAWLRLTDHTDSMPPDVRGDAERVPRRDFQRQLGCPHSCIANTSGSSAVVDRRQRQCVTGSALNRLPARPLLIDVAAVGTDRADPDVEVRGRRPAPHVAVRPRALASCATRSTQAPRPPPVRCRPSPAAARNWPTPTPPHPSGVSAVSIPFAAAAPAAERTARATPPG